MKRLLLPFICMIFSAFGQAQSPVWLLDLNGAISPGSQSYLSDYFIEAKLAQPRPQLLVIRLNTPGGFNTSLRRINQQILTSTIPVAVYVAPSGARAMSAGTYLLYAAHLAAMAPTTTLGAATPVPLIQRGMDQNSRENPHQQAMARKIQNDALAYLRALARLHGRNVGWAQDAILEGAALSAQEALKRGVIDLIAQDETSLLAQLEGRIVKVNGKDVRLHTRDAPIRFITPNWQQQFLIWLADPNIAYLMLMVAVFALLIEFYAPGFGVAGVLGGIALMLALHSLSILPLTGVGIALLVFGLILWIFELLRPGIGVLGLGGVIAWVFGSLFLIDKERTDLMIAWPLILAFAVAMGLFVVLILVLLLRQRRQHRNMSGSMSKISAAQAVDDFNGQGWVWFEGEQWQAYSSEPITKGQKLRIVKRYGLRLEVELWDKH